MAAIYERVARIEGPQGRRHAPLMRIGRYSVYATDASGEQVSFQMFDRERDANKQRANGPGPG